MEPRPGCTEQHEFALLLGNRDVHGVNAGRRTPKMREHITLPHHLSRLPFETCELVRVSHVLVQCQIAPIRLDERADATYDLARRGLYKELVWDADCFLSDTQDQHAFGS